MREMNHVSTAHLRLCLTGLLSLFLLTGCQAALLFVPFEYLTWSIELTKIEKPSLAEEKYGALRGMGKGQFEDGAVKIEAYTNDPMSAIFTLTNMTQYNMKIDWRKAKFVDIYGRTHSVEVTSFSSSFCEGHTRDDGTLTEIRRAQCVKIRVTPPGRPQIKTVWGWEHSGMTGRTVEVSFPLQVEEKSYEYVSTFRITHLRTGT